MDAKALLGAVSLLVGTSALADGARGPAANVDRSPAAMLYLEIPLAAKHRAKPALGFRMERVAMAGPARFGAEPRTPTLVDFKLNHHDDDPRSQALNVNKLAGHPGAIAGIAVGAVAVLAAISNSGGSDGGGGGY
ncbi:MAG TPA: hypothetical protein VFJ95_13905 [Gammaproteobacteria bacterium]|nr:hypothetical protein [Gammaproteobacteria bacterium]